MTESTNSVLVLLGDSRLAMFEKHFFVACVVEHIIHFGVHSEEGINFDQVLRIRALRDRIT